MNGVDVVEKMLQTLRAATSDEAQGIGYSRLARETLSTIEGLDKEDLGLIESAYRAGWLDAVQRVQDGLGKVLDKMTR